MAQFNEILAGRFNRFVQKHFSMKGREGASTIAADVQMGMQFNSGAENRYLEGWDLFAVEGVVAAFAANFPQTELRNPLGSGVIAVITRAAIIDTTAGTQLTFTPLVFFHGATGDQPSVRAAFPFDNRNPRAGSTLIVSDNSGAAQAAVGGTGKTVGIGAYAANVTYDYLRPGSDEFPLLPGDAVLFNGVAVNTPITYLWWWRERALESSELK